MYHYTLFNLKKSCRLVLFTNYYVVQARYGENILFKYPSLLMHCRIKLSFSLDYLEVAVAIALKCLLVHYFKLYLKVNLKTKHAEYVCTTQRNKFLRKVSAIRLSITSLTV